MTSLLAPFPKPDDEATSRLDPDTVLAGRYRIIEQLGAGGMGEVYRANDSRLERDVAIKVLKLASVDDDQMHQRFEREMKSVAALAHPNVVKLFDVVDHGEEKFAVMELVEGKTLREVIGEGLDWQTSLRLAHDISSGLNAAHGRNLMHRDIKPENVVISATGQAMVLDFGLARREQPNRDEDFTANRAILGTIPYMSPEQADGEELSCATDLFSLGTVLFEMLVGVNPFRGDTNRETLRNLRHLRTPPSLQHIRADIPNAVDVLLANLLRREPTDRPSAAKTTAQLRDLLDGANAAQASSSVVAGSTSIATSIPTNLPLRPGNLTGRDGEIVSVGELLAQHPIVTILGTGGVGKTSIAFEVARQRIDRYPGGVWLCELDAVRQSEDLPDVLAGVLEGNAGTLKGLHELVARLTGPANLLLLDNCEHLVDAVADLAETLSQRVPNLTILTTSREKLGVAGEFVWRVEGLPCSGRVNAAADLFAARANAVAGCEFRVEQQPIVERIVIKLDGLPLAIELAAAKLDSMSLEELLEGLDDQASLLSGQRRSRGRQSTMERTIAWSFELLDAEERRMLTMLSVFASWFSSPAAIEVCGMSPDGKGRLRRLVEQSVVIRTERNGKSRYRLLAPIRQFCQARTEEAARVRARERHAYYYAKRAVVLGRGISGENELDCSAALTEEWADLRDALAWGRENRVIEVAVDSIISMARTIFFQMRTEAYQWLQDAIVTFGAEIADRPDVNWVAALAWYTMADHDKALEYLDRSEATTRTPQAAWVRYILLSSRNKLSEAATAFERGRKLAEECGDPLEQRWFQCSSMLVSALVMQDANDPRIDQELRAGTEFVSNLAWPAGQAFMYFAHTMVALHRGDYGLADEYNKRVIEIATQSGNTSLLSGAAFLSSSIEMSKPELSRLSSAVDYLRSNVEKGDLKFRPVAIRSIVIGLADCGYPESATRCSAIVDSLIGTGLTNALTPRYEETLSHLRETLGEAQFHRLQREGAPLTVQDVLNLGEQALERAS